MHVQELNALTIFKCDIIKGLHLLTNNYYMFSMIFFGKKKNLDEGVN